MYCVRVCFILDRYRKLEGVIQRPFFDPRDVYAEGVTKDKRRSAIANSLSQEVSVVAPSRLLTLLGQGIKWQQHQGLLPHGERIDLFRGIAVTAVGTEDEDAAAVPHVSLRFGDDTNAESAVFSNNGQCIVTGTNDGFIEVWNHMTGKIRKDLKYQVGTQTHLSLSLFFLPPSISFPPLYKETFAC